MRTKLLEAVETPVVSLDAMKDFARVSFSEDDFLLQGLIKTATAWVEEATKKTLLKKKWRCTHYNDAVLLPHGPVIEILEVKRGRQVFTEKDYTAHDKNGTVHLICPSSLDTRATVVTYTSGFGETPEEVPETLKHAVMTTVTYIYENRYAASAMPALPPVADPWIAHHRAYQMA